MHDLDNFFKNKEIPLIDTSSLQENYVPDVVLCRNSQIETISRSIRGVISGQLDNTLFLFGLTGSGKTLTTMHIFEYLRKNVPQAAPIYINVRGAQNQYELAFIFGKSIKAQIKPGLMLPQIYERIFQKLDRMKQVPIIAIDEIDTANGSNWFIYSLLRLRKRPSLYIFISNTANFIESLDLRTKSSLGVRSVIFPPYTEKQIYEILKAKFEGVVDDSLLRAIAEKSEEKADVRFAFQLFLATISRSREFDDQMYEGLLQPAYLDLIQEPRWELLRSFGVEGMFLFVCIMKAHYFNLCTCSVKKLYQTFAEGTACSPDNKIEGLPLLADDRFFELINKMVRLRLISKKKRYVPKRDGTAQGYKNNHKITNPYGGEFYFLIPFDYSGHFVEWLIHRLSMDYDINISIEFLHALTFDQRSNAYVRIPC